MTIRRIAIWLSCLVLGVAAVAGAADAVRLNVGTGRALLSGGKVGASPVLSGCCSYQGPAAVINGIDAVAWYSCSRGYGGNFGQRACNVCNVSDVACVDVVVGSNGFVTIPLVGGSDCSVVICTVKTLYDQSSNVSLSNPTQATVANRFTISVNCINGKPCAVGTYGASQFYTSAASLASVAQPWTISLAARRNGHFTSFGTAISAATLNSGLGWNNTANLARLYAGTNTTASATDSAFHAIQATGNSASGIINVDAVATTVNANTQAFAGAVRIGSDGSGNNCDCSFLESGVWPIGFSPAQSSAMSSNQHGAYGF